MLSFWRDTLTVIRPGERISRGTPVPDWDNATEHTIKRCFVAQASTNENEGERVLNLDNRLRVHAPIGSDVKAGDKVIYQGVTFKVHGVPFVWASPTGRLEHVAFTLIKWVG